MITEVVYGEVEDYVLTAQLPGLGTAGTLGLGSILVVVAWQSIQRRRHGAEVQVSGTLLDLGLQRPSVASRSSTRG